MHGLGHLAVELLQVLRDLRGGSRPPVRGPRGRRRAPRPTRAPASRWPRLHARPRRRIAGGEKGCSCASDSVELGEALADDRGVARAGRSRSSRRPVVAARGSRSASSSLRPASLAFRRVSPPPPGAGPESPKVGAVGHAASACHCSVFDVRAPRHGCAPLYIGGADTEHDSACGKCRTTRSRDRGRGGAGVVAAPCVMGLHGTYSPSTPTPPLSGDWSSFGRVAHIREGPQSLGGLRLFV